MLLVPLHLESFFLTSAFVGVGVFILRFLIQRALTPFAYSLKIDSSQLPRFLDAFFIQAAWYTCWYALALILAIPVFYNNDWWLDSDHYYLEWWAHVYG